LINGLVLGWVFVRILVLARRHLRVKLHERWGGNSLQVFAAQSSVCALADGRIGPARVNGPAALAQVTVVARMLATMPRVARRSDCLHESSGSGSDSPQAGAWAISYQAAQRAE
jgi:hypothetical protein